MLLLAVRRIALLLPDVGPLSKLRKWETLLYWTATFFLWQHRPDLLHVIAEGGMFIRAAHSAGIPVLYQEPAMPWYSEEASALYHSLADVLPLSSELMAVSPRIAQLCRDRMPCPAHVSVLPIMIEDSAGETPSRRDSTQSVTFGFAARIEKLKGADVLLEAFALLLEKHSNARLRIAGVGEDEPELRERAAAMRIADRCEFPGPYSGNDEKSAFMQSVDVLVHPSLAEGTPCSIIEAMAYGLPIIATAVGGVPDMMSDEVGIMVPASNATALSDAMAEIAAERELRTRMGRAARKRYESLFSPEAVLPVLLGTYSRVISRERNNSGALSDNRRTSLHPWAEVRV
jgi:glycosyltransferase involved in cell wall biosynthesis